MTHGNQQVARRDDREAVPTFSLPPLLEQLLGQAQTTWKTTTISRALTPVERSTLQQIRDEASAWLAAKADIPASLKITAKLLLAFPAANLGEAAAVARSEAYEIALSDKPTWAVRAAATNWIRGEVACLGDRVNLAFPPSPPQLRDLAKNAVVEVRLAHLRVDKLLNAKVASDHTPEHRAAMLKRFSEITKGAAETTGEVKP